MSFCNALVNRARRFSKDCQGGVGILFGLSAVPLFGMAGMALDHGRQVVQYSEIDTWVEEACQRLDTAYFDLATSEEKRLAAEEVIALRSINATELPSDFSYTVGETSGVVSISMSGTIALGLSGLIGSGSHVLDINEDCGLPPSPPTGAGTIVFADNFETPAVTRFPQGTIVHQTAASWSTLAGPGLQYWHNSTYQLNGITTPDGEQMVELDSTDNPGTGGVASPTLNSVISTSIDIAQAGRYELSFMYRSRTTRRNDNGIEAYWAADGDALPGISIITVDNNTTWSTYTVSIDVSAPGRYHLSLGAIGQPNFVGGLLDQVVLSII